MKKTFIITIVSLLLFCSGCNNSMSSSDSVSDSMSFKTEINYYDEEYECSTVIDKEGNLSSDFTAPKNIAGFKIYCSENKVSIKYKDMEYTSSPDNIQLCNAVALIHDIFTNQNKNKNPITKNGKKYCYSGDIQGTEYTVNTTSSGIPITVEMPDKFLKIEIFEFSLIKK